MLIVSIWSNTSDLATLIIEAHQRGGKPRPISMVDSNPLRLLLEWDFDEGVTGQAFLDWWFEEKKIKEIIEAVTDFVYDRHSDLTPSNVIGFDPDELAQIKTDDGKLVFTVENVHITEKAVEDGNPAWYVSATLFFETDGQPIEGSTDIYQIYRCGSEWCIEWHSC